MNKLFDFDEMDKVGLFVFEFTHCKLKQDIGMYKAGDVIDTIYYNVEFGQLTFPQVVYQVSYSFSACA